MAEPLERRVIATRNACVEALARRHGWTLPTADDLRHLSPEMGVGDAWRRWMDLNPPAPRPCRHRARAAEDGCQRMGGARRARRRRRGRFLSWALADPRVAGRPLVTYAAGNPLA